MDEDERKRLLWPPWALNGTPRYDALDDEAKAVWRQTRGQRIEDDSQTRWAHELSGAVHKGLITQAEADDAMKRVGDK
jgi:hypothetical protein